MLATHVTYKLLTSTQVPYAQLCILPMQGIYNSTYRRHLHMKQTTQTAIQFSIPHTTCTSDMSKCKVCDGNEIMQCSLNTKGVKELEPWL